MAYDITKVAGEGLDELDAGSSMPLIRILQDQSPQINPRKEEYVAGSKAGDLYFNKTKSVLKAPLEIIPVATKSVYVEWTPKAAGGGIVATHPLSIVSDPRYRKVDYKESLGANELKFTTYWCVLALIDNVWTEALLAMTSTQLKVSRALAGDIARFRYSQPELSKVVPPVFARRLKLGTTLEKNSAQQEYFNFKVSDFVVLDFVTDEQLLTSCAEARSRAMLDLPAPKEVKQITADNADDDAF